MAVHKCQCVVFHSGKRKPPNINLQMYGVQIERCREVQFLGGDTGREDEFQSAHHQRKKRMCR